MSVVYKYPLSWSSKQDVELPWGAKILDIQLQAGTPCLWARVDPTPSSHKQTHRIYRAGTGDTIPEDTAEHISTVQEGDLVWHFFRRT